MISAHSSIRIPPGFLFPQNAKSHILYRIHTHSTHIGVRDAPGGRPWAIFSIFLGPHTTQHWRPCASHASPNKTSPVIAEMEDIILKNISALPLTQDSHTPHRTCGGAASRAPTPAAQHKDDTLVRAPAHDAPRSCGGCVTHYTDPPPSSVPRVYPCTPRAAALRGC